LQRTINQMTGSGVITAKEDLSNGFYLNGNTTLVGYGLSTSASQGAGDEVAFDASRCSSIYGNSDTVMVDSYNQPIAIYLG